MSPSNQARWFTEEVQPHEPALRAYLHARFPTLIDQDDLVQETYTRLLRAKAAGEVRYARAFLFTTARNAALDLFRRRRTAPIETVAELAEVSALAPTCDAREIVGHQQELDILTEAVRALPERCRQVVLLRYLDGLSYKEIAERLGIGTETVKTQLATGMRRCSDHFAAYGLIKLDTSTASA